MEKQVRFIGGSYDGFAKVVNINNSQIFLHKEVCNRGRLSFCKEVYRVEEFKNNTGVYFVAFYEGEVE